ncbi:unnamed protein product [Polarella glacialis]|uniref:Uncharacterized protein n=1 Tax=Polarella glacialis TaxID=89957 RepID=A0A813HAI9_POLGL|nr:unnamed protein product [Polarella glacialis]
MSLVWRTAAAFTSRHARSSNSFFRASANSGLHGFSSTLGLGAPPELEAHGCQRSAALCIALRPSGHVTWSRGFATRRYKGFWTSEEGHADILSFMATYHPRVDTSTMTPEWWTENIQSLYSALDVKCSMCEYHSSPRLHNIFHLGRGIACICNGTARWASPEGFTRCKEILSSARFDSIDHSGIDRTWWQKNIRNLDSKLIASCRECGQEVASRITDICNKGQGFGCACQRKTELKLLEWLQLHFGTACKVEREVRGCVNAATGRHLPFDFRVKERILIELDGWLHFCGTDFAGNPCKATSERDLMKERWALGSDHVLIRVLQRDVWSDRADWQSYLLNSIAEAELDSRPRVILPDAPEYQVGIYHELRVGNCTDSILKDKQTDC